MTNLQPFKRIQISGKHSDKEVLVSIQDYDELSKYKWYLVRGYAQCTIKGKCYKMHRLVLDAPSGILVDHRDRNKLNNTRDNLRFADPLLNADNRGLTRDNRNRKFIGVEKLSERRGYRAVITRNGIRKISCSYKTEFAAAIRYNQMLDEINSDALRNYIELTSEEQNKVLIQDSLAKKITNPQSIIKGISFRSDENRWIVRKNIKGKRVHIGKTRTLDEAILIYNSY